MKFWTCIILLAVILFTISGGCLHFIPWFSGATYPKIIPDSTGSMPNPPGYEFLFQEYSIVIDVPVESAVYAGARNADKSARIYDERIQEEEWLAGIYSSMIADPAQDRFYGDLLSRFREIRKDRLLDDDEYLELITVFVQSITYENLNLTNPKFPVETYVDGRGDCDDKSMFLAGLLAREGYRVALLYFDEELHMAVGVDCGNEGYKNTGYGFIETTNVSLVGISPSGLEGNVKLRSDPQVIPVGNGTLMYSQYDQTRRIWDKMSEMEQILQTLENEIYTMEARLNILHDDLERQKTHMDLLFSSGNRVEYNRLVIEYNGKVNSYNALLAQYQAKSDEYNQHAEMYNLILTHKYDRKGIYEKFFS